MTGTAHVVERPNPRKEHASTRPVRFEDAELVKEVMAGKTDAYAELVHKYQDRVFNACWRICGHLEDARDITQDAFVKAFENMASFRQQSNFYTWIFRVAVNLALSHRRKSQRRRTLTLDASPDVQGTQASGLARLADEGSRDPAETAGDAEMLSAASMALHALEEDQRVVVVLRDIEGLDYEEIGEILGIPKGTVKSRLHRGRMTLRAAIAPGNSRDS